MTPARSFLSKWLQCSPSSPIPSLHLLEWLEFSQPSTLVSTEVNLELSYLVGLRNFNILLLFSCVLGLYTSVSSNFIFRMRPSLICLLPDVIGLNDTFKGLLGRDLCANYPIAFLSIRPAKLCISFDSCSFSLLSFILSIL
jgi:hypothetical protein